MLSLILSIFTALQAVCGWLLWMWVNTATAVIFCYHCFKHIKIPFSVKKHRNQASCFTFLTHSHFISAVNLIVVSVQLLMSCFHCC